MYFTNKGNEAAPIKMLVDLKELRVMLSCGSPTAREIARRANASIKIGKRRLYNVKKIEEFITAGAFAPEKGV